METNMKDKLNNAITLLSDGIKKLASSNNEGLLEVIEAYNNYISDETDRINYIYNLDKKSDLINIINMGATAKTISELTKSENNFVMVDRYENFVSMPKIEIINVIEINALCLAKFILAYPFVTEYKPIYVKYITNTLLDDGK